jgi:rhodanese-related sulfurtransferase
MPLRRPYCNSDDEDVACRERTPLAKLTSSCGGGAGCPYWRTRDDEYLDAGSAAASVASIAMTIAIADVVAAQADIYHATLVEGDAPAGQQRPPQVSTDELRRILADGSMLVLDARKRAEFVAGHIAGARNAGVAPEAPAAEYAAAVERLLGGDRSRPLVLYCNGQYCKAGRRVAGQLVEAGFSGVRRYQLGIQVWRALSLPVEIELEGIVRIFGVDRTAIYFDARPPQEFARGTLPGAHNVPADGMTEDGLDAAPMPRTDFNTRLILFGRDRAQARALADVIGRKPFQNVSYFPGTFDEVAAAVGTGR